jgi:hypothetical protein
LRQDEGQGLAGDETRQERREKRKRKKREKMPQHGKSLPRVYRNAVLKRLKKKED